MATTHYAHIVIGKGLLGAAAARHLSAQCQGVALIGPDEPAQRTTHQGVFGSHYDEGRITRVLDPDPIWGQLAQRSIERYRDLERRSGVPFYHEVGHLTVGPAPTGPQDYVARVQAVGNALGVRYETYAGAALAARFPCLAFPPGSVGLYQPDHSGHISPRAHVQAQAKLAQQQGSALIPETVHTVCQVGQTVEVRTEEGGCYRAERVLLAVGGFSNSKALLPRPLDIAVYARTVVLLALEAAEVVRLQGMPSIIYKPADPAQRCYILPPIRYPDGQYYLKIGGDPHDPTLHSFEALRDWFQSPGRPAAAQALMAMLQRIVPDVRPQAVHTEPCVTTLTPTGHLYVDKLADGRLGILTGGNGSAAKSADEIGRMGALMMLHEPWTYDLAATHFQARFV
ncbi:MAG: NAD(P)/FAD-dependent oxidoreductase [Candidatus Tectimicrobiota bacterium]